MQAQREGATLIHVVTRCTPTSAFCDIHVPIRASSDIVFLGGLINYRLNSKCWNTDPFFQETEGSFTNTDRLMQWHYKATNAPGDSRSDAWFTYQLGKRLKKLYVESKESRDQGVRNLVWDYEPDQPESLTGEPDVKKILREINGYVTDDPSQHSKGIHQLQDDGSTTCASWLCCGVFPAPDRNLAACKESLPPGYEGAYSHWGYSWPGNHRLIYNRASTDLQGQPWSARKQWIWWDGQQWAGYDVPDGNVADNPAAALGILARHPRSAFSALPLAMAREDAVVEEGHTRRIGTSAHYGGPRPVLAPRGPGVFLFTLPGLGLLATQSHVLARWLDRTELALRRLAQPVREKV